MSKAQLPRNRIDKQIKDARLIKKTQGMIRAKNLASSITVGTAPTRPSASSTTNNGINYLPTAGGSMMGPIAFSQQIGVVTSGVLNISNTTSAYKSYVVVSGNATINTISGAAFSGQLLFLQGVVGYTLTLTTAGNIKTNTGSSITITNTNIAILIFDATQNKWQVISNGSSSGGGVTEDQASVVWTGVHNFNGTSTSINSPTVIVGDELTDSVYINGTIKSDLYPVGKTIRWNITSEAESLKIQGTGTALTYNVGSTDKHSFTRAGTEVFSIGSSGIVGATSASFAGSSFSVTSPSIFIGDQLTDSISIGGTVTSDLYIVGKTIRWNNTSENESLKIQGVGSSLIYNVGSTDSHSFRYSNITALTISSSGITGAIAASFTGTSFSITSPVIYLGDQSTDKLYTTAQLNSDLKFATHPSYPTSFYTIDFQASSGTATAGFLTPPAQVYAYLRARLGGVNIKIPCYQD